MLFLVIEEDVRTECCENIGFSMRSHKVGFISGSTPSPQCMYDAFMRRSVAGGDGHLEGPLMVGPAALSPVIQEAHPAA
jgi:hypothetical protein